MNLVIRDMQPTDWAQVAEIYKQGIETGNATFQQTIPSWEEWNMSHAASCRIVAEVSVYVKSNHRGLQIGTKLLQAIISDSESKGFWTLQSGILIENSASIALHKKSGFREIGYREKVAKMNNVWRDTVLFERRSSVAGID